MRALQVLETTAAAGPADRVHRSLRASSNEPQYLVRSDNGSEAVHKPDALRRV
jgi:hypothetical protein